jgi:hypothetical protein
MRQLSTGGNHHTAQTHASGLPCCYCTSSYSRNVRSHFSHAIFMYGVHVMFLVRDFLRSGMCPLCLTHSFTCPCLVVIDTFIFI